VNFDDPTTYHLYFGDDVGRPGTILTFFPWPDAPKGRRGTGQVIAISFLIPVNSINYWIDRFKNQKIHFQGPTKRFGDNEEVLSLYGLELELVAHKSRIENATLNVWKEGPIPIEHAIRGFYSVTLSEEGYEGNETSNSILSSEAAILSPRGKVLENGIYPRFFRRLAEGVF
jgi:glyoxalase family protein